MNCFVLISTLVSMYCFSRKFIYMKWDLAKINKANLNYNKELKSKKLKSKKVKVLKMMKRQLLKLVLN